METKNYLEKEISGYSQMSDFDKLKSYSYLFADPRILHQKLGEYFVNSGNPGYAELEFKKALDSNENDSVSRANLIVVQLQLKKNDEALLNYNVLEKTDSTLSAKLKQFFQ
jgi:hypothetical protein